MRIQIQNSKTCLMLLLGIVIFSLMIGCGEDSGGGDMGDELNQGIGIQKYSKGKKVTEGRYNQQGIHNNPSGTTQNQPNDADTGNGIVNGEGEAEDDSDDGNPQRVNTNNGTGSGGSNAGRNDETGSGDQQVVGSGTQSQDSNRAEDENGQTNEASDNDRSGTPPFQAQGPEVCQFSGQLIVGGSAASDGTRVNVVVDGQLVGDTLSSNGQYEIKVTGRLQNAQVQFYVNGTKVATRTWQAGGNIFLDLVVP